MHSLLVARSFFLARTPFGLVGLTYMIGLVIAAAR